jgi:hypothetical protein
MLLMINIKYEILIHNNNNNINTKNTNLYY